MTFDLSVLTAPERDVIAYWAINGGEPRYVDTLLAMARIEDRPSREAALQRLATATKRRPAIIEIREGYYRVDPEALGKYLEAKKPKKEAREG